MLLNVETILQANALPSIDHLFEFYGTPATRIRNIVDDDAAEAYGSLGGSNSTSTEQIEVLFTLDAAGFDAVDGGHVGKFSSGSLYVKATVDIDTGDTIEITRSDSANLSLRVGQVESVGSTLNILNRVEVSSLHE